MNGWLQKVLMVSLLILTWLFIIFAALALVERAIENLQ